MLRRNLDAAHACKLPTMRQPVSIFDTDNSRIRRIRREASGEPRRRTPAAPRSRSTMDVARPRRAMTPSREGASLYLGGFGRRAALTREDEVALARRIEEGEAVILRALVGSSVALRELARIGEELAAHKLRTHNVLRTADEEEDAASEQTGPWLAALIERAGTLAKELEAGRSRQRDRNALASGLERARLRRRVLDRVVGALRAAPAMGGAGRAPLEAIEEGRRMADFARAELVASCLPLVVKLATRYPHAGLSLHDLIQEGNIGLIRAADKFDFRRGVRFCTYAAWWIKQQLARAISDQAQTIRVPVHMEESRRKLLRARRALVQEHGCEPESDELLERTGLSRARIELVDGLAPAPISLDAPAGEDRDTCVGDFVPDPSAPAPDEQVAESRMRAQTTELLDELTPREQDVLRRRFGLDGAPELTLAEIGASMSLSRERIRQIEANALRKLKARSKERQLGCYLAQ
ncbi:RNA polymerase sigma factor RpoD/SigA [Sorangium sp. So ce128]|uniref:RNA polymerase sigma factor RpoD/SigA n=1 Tax=Sorangium sp. So ce128 TaxID=3133281 RepID=UPI003F610075